jgi:hypothetical protein
MLFTSFSLVAIDLGQQSDKSHQIAGGFGGLGCAHREGIQAAKLRS